MERVAGGFPPGHQDGTGPEARFKWPTDVAIADDFTAWVADFGNNCIRRIGADGRVSTVAGDGQAGFADGTGSAARFDGPNGIALGRDGNLYVADAGNARIRKMTPGGSVTTVAGDGTRGHRDGPAGFARFNYPTGIAAAPDGTLYVVDRWDHRVRVIHPDGTVGTVAGDGKPGFVDGPAARFNNPLSAVWDAHWGLVVTDSGNQAVRRIDSGGTVTTLAGGSPGDADGVGAAARFHWVTGIAGDGRGNLYLADTLNFRVRRMDRQRRVERVAGSGIQGVTDGPGTIARFAFMTGLERDPAGNLWVTDSKAAAVRRIMRGSLTVQGESPIRTARTRSPSEP